MRKKECHRWDRLHGLIGSADGKKYRNFAQGLTFELMVSHANRQLEKMTDRYLLIRDEQQPLGLLKLASRKVWADSLFLDEAFGTLDEEALETALETLFGLHQDGKLIGIISHVPALKERIGTQITIMQVSGGKSFLSGPGCKKVEKAING